MERDVANLPQNFGPDLYVSQTIDDEVLSVTPIGSGEDGCDELFEPVADQRLTERLLDVEVVSIAALGGRDVPDVVGKLDSRPIRASRRRAR